ncbi:hypothetical protein HJFPF1_02390 [Paramyrothecium foliicola]|nr:hypothetical protein HJFPF1_02390 [Paramyrothecium foliicola]
MDEKDSKAKDSPKGNPVFRPPSSQSPQNWKHSLEYILNPKAFEDYKKQLKLLEEQNKGVAKGHREEKGSGG